MIDKIKFSGFELNSRDSDPFIIAIGKFFINFGAVEMLTFNLIQHLAPDQFERCFKWRLGVRLDFIEKRLLDLPLDNDKKEDIRKTIDSARYMAKYRNIIAHNPVIVAEKMQDDGKIHREIGIPEVMTYPSNPKVRLILAESLNQSVDVVVELANNMHELFSIKTNIQLP